LQCFIEIIDALPDRTQEGAASSKEAVEFNNIKSRQA
jgi:hypothetical protein